MSTTLDSTTSADAALSYLAARLDLANVRMKLEDTEEGKGFTPEQSALAEGEYRKFLALHLMFADADIVPCHIVDDIWHQHILDTIAYREDCHAIFGRFLDHFPYFGMRGEDDAKDLYEAYEDTLVKYEAAFGPPPDGTWRAPDAKAKCHNKPGGPTCRTQCKPQKCR